MINMKEELKKTRKRRKGAEKKIKKVRPEHSQNWNFRLNKQGILIESKKPSSLPSSNPLTTLHVVNTFHNVNSLSNSINLLLSNNNNNNINNNDINNKSDEISITENNNYQNDLINNNQSCHIDEDIRVDGTFCVIGNQLYKMDISYLTH